MHTGVSPGQVPHPIEPPQPSSTAPHSVPPGHVVRGMQVVDVVLEVVVTVLVELEIVVGATPVVEVVGVITGVDPQDGGVGSLLDRQTFMSALRVRPHADRHARPVFPLGQSLLHAFSCVASNCLQAFGQRPA